MLVSGFFLSKKKFKVRSVVKLWLQVFFYSVTLYFISALLSREYISLKGLVKSFFPFIFNKYWYFTMYIVIYLLFPFINKLVWGIDRKSYKILIIIGLLVFSIIPNFSAQKWALSTDAIGLYIIIYLIGAYIRKYNVTFSKKKLIIGVWVNVALGLTSIIVLRTVLLSIHCSIDDPAFFVWGQYKIIPISLAVLLFLLFKDISISNARINTISFWSGSIFGVYLFHIGDLSTFFFKKAFNDSVTYNTPWLGIQMFIAVFFLFAIGTFVDKIRKHLFERPLLELLDKKLKFVQARVDMLYSD